MMWFLLIVDEARPAGSVFINIATVWLLSGMTLVPFVAWLSESLVTHLTMEKLFSCVVPFVSCLSESLVTHLTMERLFSCVGPFMCLCNQNPLPHTLQWKGFLLCGSFHVSWRSEYVVTHLTRIRFLICVGLFMCKKVTKAKRKSTERSIFPEKKITQP